LSGVLMVARRPSLFRAVSLHNRAADVRVLGIKLIRTANATRGD
jgi:hypothetical protein